MWRKEQEATASTKAEYSAKAVDHARALLDQQEADWDLLFKDIGVEPLTVWYEDVLEEPTEAVSTAARFLEIELDPAAAVAVPEIERAIGGRLEAMGNALRRPGVS